VPGTDRLRVYPWLCSDDRSQPSLARLGLLPPRRRNPQALALQSQVHIRFPPLKPTRFVQIRPQSKAMRPSCRHGGFFCRNAISRNHFRRRLSPMLSHAIQGATPARRRPIGAINAWRRLTPIKDFLGDPKVRRLSRSAPSPGVSAPSWGGASV
jgi:hypothetical protein